MAQERTRRVRRGRSPHASGLVVAVTGAASGVGRTLAARLVEDPAVRKVVAVDDSRGDLDSVLWRVIDVVDPAVGMRLSGCDVVVHCSGPGADAEAPAERRSRLLRGLDAVLEGAAAAGTRRVVVVSGAMVYGAAPDNPVPLPEDAIARAVADDSVAGDLVELEAAVERHRAATSSPAVTVVRPAMLVGPGADDPVARHLLSGRVLVIKDTAPLWQFCHVDDLASALHAVVVHALEGPLTVACDGWLTQVEVERVLGARRLEVPASLALGTADRLHRLGLTRAPSSELAYLMYPWVVGAERLRASGWRPLHDNVSALQAAVAAAESRRMLGGRRPGVRETATLGAAGATVAVLATAAVVRRDRRRRR